MHGTILWASTVLGRFMVFKQDKATWSSGIVGEKRGKSSEVKQSHFKSAQAQLRRQGRTRKQCGPHTQALLQEDLFYLLSLLLTFLYPLFISIMNVTPWSWTIPTCQACPQAHSMVYFIHSSQLPSEGGTVNTPILQMRKEGLRSL